MNRLSSPITDLKDAYDVVVIGSGYGGSIAASRMSRLGKKVCLLEKGKEFLPGEFPTTLAEAAKEMQIEKEDKNVGAGNGLYEFVVGKEISVFKGCGLGGTSLVNANVSIEAEERVFDDHRWPSVLRNNLNLLHEGIAHARKMLDPSPYPEGKNGYPVLSKTLAMRESALSMKEEFKLLDINVNFKDQRNAVGVDQKKCINCGDCVTGCNHTAKNTTQMNYLPDAYNHGAEIFTNVDVSHIECVNNHWLIYFDLHHTGREKFKAPLLFIKADIVILGGGSLGSTEILLRSAQKGLPLSEMIGKKFTGNGDVLGFGYNNDEPIHGIGLGDKATKDTIGNVGPCITSAIDLRHKPSLEEGMTLEEGSVPAPIRSVLTSALLPLSRLLGNDTDRGFSDFLKEKYRELKSMVGGAYRGAIDHTQIYLVMTHDDGDGTIRLADDNVSISWPDVGRQKIFQKVSGKLKEATKALGGTFVRNPSWTKSLGYDLVTVHPLGGCIMADDASSGVVDHKGQVFSDTSGTNLHPGLYVMDGAIIPRPLGTNPLLTISGLAERNCKLIADEMGMQLQYTFRAIPERQNEKTTGIQFTETMTGYFSDKIKGDYKKAFEEGKQSHSSFEFTLTILATDVDKFISDKDHVAGMIGSVKAPVLSNNPISISHAKFNLFVSDTSDPHKKKMMYEMRLNTKEGKTFFFKGFKDIDDNKGIDLWTDTTTLFITVYAGLDDTDEVIGKGMLKIELADFKKQLTTMVAIHPKDNADGFKAVLKFGRLFAGNVWETYFTKH